VGKDDSKRREEWEFNVRERGIDGLEIPGEEKGTRRLGRGISVCSRPRNCNFYAEGYIYPFLK